MVLADMTASQLAAEVGDELEISLATIERVMQGRRVPKRWEVERFAAALGVPLWFLERGLDGDAGGQPVEAQERLSAELAGFRRDLWRRLDDLERDLKRDQR